MILELLIPIAALIASVWAIVASKRTAREQDHLQEQFLAAEKARERDRLTEASSAALVAALRRGEHSARLIVPNGGRAEAREIHVKVDGDSVDEHRLFHDAKQPVSLLAHNAYVEFLMITHDGMPSSYLVELDWLNATGDEATWAPELTVIR